MMEQGVEQIAEAATWFVPWSISFFALSVVFVVVSFFLIVWADDYFYKSELVAIAAFVSILHWVGGATLFTPWTWSFWVMLIVGALFIIASFREDDLPLGILTLVVVASLSHEVGGAALFGLWTLTFWALIISEGLFLFWCVDHDEYIITPVSMLITAAFLEWIGGVPVLTYTYRNPIDTLMWYSIAGVVYVCARWFFETYRDGKKIAELSSRFLQYIIDYDGTHKTPNTPQGFERLHDKLESEHPDRVSYYKEHASRESGRLHSELLLTWKTTLQQHGLPTSKPRASDRKEEMFVWFIAWPWSLIWFFFEELIEHLFEIIRDLVVKVWDFVFGLISDLLGSITDYNFRNVDKSMIDDD